MGDNEEQHDDDQHVEDKRFLESIIQQQRQVVDPNTPDLRVRVIGILRRTKDMGRRRGGPTRPNILSLRDLIPGDHPKGNKGDIIESMLQSLEEVVDDQENSEDQRSVSNDRPEGPVPDGWGDVLPGGPANQDSLSGESPFESTLKKLKQGELRYVPQTEILQLLIKEQDEAKTRQSTNDDAFLSYLKTNLHIMAGDGTPHLPTDTSSKWVWFLYRGLLEKNIASTQAKLLSHAGSQPEPARAHDKSRESRGRYSSGAAGATKEDPIDMGSSSSDSDLQSYYPRKRFALKRKRTSKEKRKKKKSKKKKKKKKRRKKRAWDTSSESSSSTDTESDEEEPNGKRVKSGSYGPYHYEQLKEFKDEYDAYHEEGRNGEWPSDEALSFIAKKFARPGTKFADKNTGVKKAFLVPREKAHARKRTAQIYEMSATAAELRLERNEIMAQKLRRMEGASQAKKARIKSKLSKLKRASVEEEQTLVARIGVYCDLVLMGKKSWDTYHNYMRLGGQKEAVVESTGGLVSASIASKAWKAALSTQVKSATKKTSGLRGGASQNANPRAVSTAPTAKSLVCNYCNGKGHWGRNCPDKKAGKPPHPDSRRVQWDKQKEQAQKLKKKQIKKEA